MGARKHRNVGPGMRVVRDDAVDALEELNEFGAALDEHQRMARVVDVFRGAGKVHELSGASQLVVMFDLALDPVFDRLHVVIGGLFNRLDGFAVFEREVVGEAAQERLPVVRKVREFRKAGFGKRDQPFDFNANARVHEGIFGEDAAQGVALAGIAAVERGKSGKRIKRHGG